MGEIERISLALQLELKDDAMPDEELFADFFSKVASLLFDHDNTSSLDEGEERAFAAIQAWYLSEAYLEKQSEESFGMGAMWGAVEVRNSFARLIKRRQQSTERRFAMKNNELLFQIVDEHPGVTHAELAEKCGKSVSRLTQIISSFDDLDLLNTVRIGRSKHYYLSSFAQSELNQTRRQSNSTYTDENSSLTASENEPGSFAFTYERNWATIRALSTTNQARFSELPTRGFSRDGHYLFSNSSS